MFAGERHWTERAASPAIFGEAGNGGGDGPPRVTPARERQERVRLVNRVLGPLGLVLAEWAASSYVLRTRTGRSEMVPDSGRPRNASSAGPATPSPARGTPNPRSD